MYRITKRLLFVLLTLMTYLPMTVINVANAMPNVSIPVPAQSVMAMDMTTMMNTAATGCHHQASKTCNHCSNQYAPHCAHSACSVSLAITTHNSLLSINRNLKNSDEILRIDTQFQQPTLLLRPPISI